MTHSSNVSESTHTAQRGRAAVGVLVALCAGMTAYANPADIVSGVSQIAAPGLPGPVHPVTPEWDAIAAGDEDASFPSTLVVARDYGAGRVTAIGHDGLIHAINVLDNGVLMQNMIEWLDVAGTSNVLYTTGHSEWVQGQLNGLATAMAPDGYTFTPVSGRVLNSDLANGSVLIVGNAWGSFTEPEIERIRQWVDNGGGLCMAGLGWSWGGDIEDYPMMQLAEPYGVRWLQTTITDPTDQHNGSAIFQEFYPNIEVGSIYDAMDVIDNMHTLHPTGLDAVLESDATKRLSFVRAHQSLQIAPDVYPAGHPQRQDVFDYYYTLIPTWPDQYAKIQPIDEGTYPTSAWLRERVWRTWRDCLELTPTVKADMATAGSLSGIYADLFDDYGILVLDNMRLDSVQRSFMQDYLAVVPSDLFDIRVITVTGLLGNAPISIPLRGRDWQINIFGFSIGQYSENSFPNDVSPGTVDIFCSTLAHEVNHIVDVHVIEPSDTLRATKNQLLADAGTDSQNYLRSIISDGFFATNPQEFVASISNQWFTDSAKTVELGVVRFDNGRPDPINQALFFAEVYSQGSNITRFYTIDTQGNLATSTTPVCRDGQGRINGIVVDGLHYEFTLGAAGRVTGYTVNPVVDTDGDGFPDGCDSCAGFDDSVDSDGDGIPDGCDVCPGDTDGDNDVDLSDLAQVLSDFGRSGAAFAGDVDADGDVDLTDLALVLSEFGRTCS